MEIVFISLGVGLLGPKIFLLNSFGNCQTFPPLCSIQQGMCCSVSVAYCQEKGYIVAFSYIFLEVKDVQHLFLILLLDICICCRELIIQILCSF